MENQYFIILKFIQANQSFICQFIPTFMNRPFMKSTPILQITYHFHFHMILLLFMIRESLLMKPNCLVEC